MAERAYLTSLLSPGQKIGIDSLMSPITQRKHSHKGAWAKIIRAQLKLLGYEATILKDEPWTDFDVVLIEHGMEFKGTFNVFGGATDELASRLTSRLVEAVNRPRQPVRLVSCDIPMPDVAGWVESRKSKCEPKFKELDTEELGFCQGQVLYYERLLQSPGLVLGDSHSLSTWLPNWELARLDGQTLYGFLDRRGFDLYVEDHHQMVVSYFGNIDIRHHLARQPDPGRAVQALVWQYVSQLYEVRQRVGSVYVVEPLFIESEDRKLPKTGYYKGTPFYGDWATRNWLRDCFCHYLREWAPQYGLETISWPESLRNAKGELDQEKMEANQSVHLSPEHYRTNLDTGEVRW